MITNARRQAKNLEKCEKVVCKDDGKGKHIVVDDDTRKFKLMVPCSVKLKESEKYTRQDLFTRKRLRSPHLSLTRDSNDRSLNYGEL